MPEQFAIGERVMVRGAGGVQWSAIVRDHIGDLVQIRYENSDHGALKSPQSLDRYMPA